MMNFGGKPCTPFLQGATRARLDRLCCYLHMWTPPNLVPKAGSIHPSPFWPSGRAACVQSYSNQQATKRRSPCFAHITCNFVHTLLDSDGIHHIASYHTCPQLACCREASPSQWLMNNDVTVINIIDLLYRLLWR